MALQVSFRVVGLYCYFENLNLSTVSPTSTVKEVMDAIKQEKPGFDYQTIKVENSQKEIVSELIYDFNNSSTQPYNTTARPQDGRRELSISLTPSAPAAVWQYYRSITGTLNGSTCELKLFNKDQPSFADLALNSNYDYFGSLPEGFQIRTYNLTWRLVTIQMTPEKQAEFMLAYGKKYK